MLNGAGRRADPRRGWKLLIMAGTSDVRCVARPKRRNLTAAISVVGTPSPGNH
ncbi:hypothetical protein LNQ03_03380 [Klebsiella pneumoniae subsp. pneumoniae]|nr:hypothetical protein [Klebsiella pneumoniae subsp. pneumoniae]